nr:deleted in lung and esophageal cancer protein 1-like isoform X1 [Mirounga angustirostris]XP_054362723.1 deleted in lung and esophageal cancer protein 1-like isoform X1 [Mirounga angustirostris]XP_054362724.1 deleted in lung and esophageal cancer protein 1-like isoform X1 [Mirounga angustirostris]
MACLGYALGFMSLDEEVERELPGRRRRLQDFAVGPLRLDLCSYVRPAQLSVELDYGGGVEFRHQASDLIPEQPCTGVLSELLSTHHLKLSNTTEIPQYFRLLVSRPFSVAQGGASRSRSAPGPEQGCEEEQATGGKRLVLHPQENMLVSGGSAGGHRARGHLPVTRTRVDRRVHASVTHLYTLVSRHRTPSWRPLPQPQRAGPSALPSCALVWAYRAPAGCWVPRWVPPSPRDLTVGGETATEERRAATLGSLSLCSLLQR